MNYVQYLNNKGHDQIFYSVSTLYREGGTQPPDSDCAGSEEDGSGLDEQILYEIDSD